MSTRAKASGAVGSVIDGRFRDLQEQRGLGFPVFILGSLFCDRGAIANSVTDLCEGCRNSASC